MSVFKREPIASGRNGEKKVHVCLRVCKIVLEDVCMGEGQTAEQLQKGWGIDCSCRKMFLIYLGHRSRMGPSVSLHGPKIQSEKNNTFSSDRRQRETEREKAKIERRRKKKTEIGSG